MCPFQGIHQGKAIEIRLLKQCYLSRNEHNQKIRTTKERTDVGKYFFVNRTIKSWNQLTAGLLASFPCKLNTFRKKVKNAVTSKWISSGVWVQIREVTWSEVLWSELTIYMKWSCFEVKCSEVSYGRFLGTKVTILVWPFTEGTWMYSDYFIWCVSCTMVILTYIEMCGCVFCNVCVFWQLCGCFRNMCTYIYLCVLVFTVFCIVGTMFLYCFAYVYFILIVLYVLM